jgi:hypothetical protein
MQDCMGQCCTVMAMTILAGKSGTESFLPPEEFSRLREGVVDPWRKSALIVAPPAPPVILVEITVPRYEYKVFQILRLTRSGPNWIKSRFWGPFDWRLWSMALVCDPGEGVVVACGGNTNTRLLACLPHASTARDTDSVHLLMSPSSLESYSCATRFARNSPRQRCVVVL